MRQTLHKIFSLFSKSEKIQCYWIFFGMVIRGVVEVAGVASIMPFIAVISNQDIVHSNSYLLAVYTFSGCDSTKEFIFILGVVVFGIILLTNCLAAITDWYLFKFIWLRGFSLSQRLFAKYLSKDYSFYLSINTSELAANILTEVSYYMKGILRPFMEMVVRSVVCIFIFMLLVSIDPVLALIVGITLGSAYMGIFLFVRKKLNKIGEERVYHNRRQFLYINEALGGIKDVKVKGCEQFFLDSFSFHAH